MRKAQFFYLLRRGLLSGGLNFIKEGLVMASKFITQGLSFPSTGSAEFNGSSDYIQVKDDGKGSAFDTQTFTISAWVYVDELIGYNPIIWSYDHSSHTPPYYAQNFRIESDGAIFFGFNISGTYDNIISATGLVQPKTWNFISITFTSGSQKIYLNGSEVASKTISGLFTYYNQAVRIGRSVFSSYMFGNLANVAFWNRALSSDEINSVMWKSYEALTSAESNGLQAWYSLDDISGTSVPDSSGNGNTGTAN